MQMRLSKWLSKASAVMLLGLFYCKAKKLLLRLFFIPRCRTHASSMRLLGRWARKKYGSCSIGWRPSSIAFMMTRRSRRRRYRHPACDMFYLVLARRTGATLFTLDKKMWTLARDMHVNCIEEVDLRALSVLV